MSKTVTTKQPAAPASPKAKTTAAAKSSKVVRTAKQTEDTVAKAPKAAASVKTPKAPREPKPPKVKGKPGRPRKIVADPAAEAERAKAERAERNERGRPKTLKGTILSDHDLQIPLRDRPMTGIDLGNIAKNYDLTISELGAALGIQNDHGLAKSIRDTKVIPFDVEVLARLYLEFPVPAPWGRKSIKEVFEALYRPYLDQFDDKVELSYAETAAFSLFTALVDRSSSTGYRWVEGQGKSRLVIGMMLRKVMSVPKPRETLERIAALVHTVRGGNLKERVTLPQPGVPPQRRGRSPVVDRESRSSSSTYDQNPFPEFA